MKGVLDTGELINRFFNTYVSKKHPSVSKQTTDEICRVMFKLLKQEMENGTLRTIRIKYFGMFTVFRGRAIGVKNKTSKVLKKGKVDQAYMDNVNYIVDNYLNKFYNESLPSD